MKILHTGDLHIGKTVNGFSMLEDQEYILNAIIGYIAAEKPGAFLIAGDVYDKQAPSAEAVALFDRFITEAAGLCPAVFTIPGNHDSPERLSFASVLMERGGVFIARMPRKVTLDDEYGPIDFCLLPFTKPAFAKQLFPEAEIEDSAGAVVYALDSLNVDIDRRSVLLAHQPFTAMGRELERCESESLYLGGADAVDTSVLAPYRFDYAALGHLHGPQRAGPASVRYAGSPLKYSFSEYLHRKSIVMVEINEKGSAETRLLPMNPKRDMRKIKGPIIELIRPEIAAEANAADYLHVTLTDGEVYDAMEKLRAVYPNVMQLAYDNARSRAEDGPITADGTEDKTPFELFEAFFEQRNGEGMSAEQKAIIRGIL